MSISDNPKLQRMLDEARCRIAELEEEKAEHEASFDLRWKADMRAIKRWQEKTGRTQVWPDHADLCVWLLERIAELEAERDQLQKIFKEISDEHDRLEDENAALRKALKPFAHAACRNTGVNQLPEACQLIADPTARWSTLTIGDLHRAAEALVVRDLCHRPPRTTQPHEQTSSPARNSD